MCWDWCNFERPGYTFDGVLITLYLLVRVAVGDSGLCCCVCVTSFERSLTPLFVDWQKAGSWCIANIAWIMQEIVRASPWKLAQCLICIPDNSMAWLCSIQCLTGVMDVLSYPPRLFCYFCDCGPVCLPLCKEGYIYIIYQKYHERSRKFTCYAIAVCALLGRTYWHHAFWNSSACFWLDVLTFFFLCVFVFCCINSCCLGVVCEAPFLFRPFSPPHPATPPPPRPPAPSPPPPFHTYTCVL